MVVLGSKSEAWNRVWGEKEGEKASMRHVTETTVVNSGFILLRTFWEAYGTLVRTLYLRIDHDKLPFLSSLRVAFSRLISRCMHACWTRFCLLKVRCCQYMENQSSCMCVCVYTWNIWCTLFRFNRINLKTIYYCIKYYIEKEFWNVKLKKIYRYY